MFDLAITGGVVVTPAGRRNVGIGVKDGVIAALRPPGEAIEATRVIDASGRLVLPGGVDAHVHCREPGFTHKEGFASATRAAVCGGVTTIMVMPTDNPWTTTASEFAHKRDLLAGQAYADVALQAAVAADLSTLSEIKRLVELGAISFELFLGDVPAAYTFGDNANLEVALRRIGETGRVAGITPADDTLIAGRAKSLDATKPLDAAAFAGTRPPASEALGVARACLIAELTGARVHLRQMSSRASIAVLRDFRRRIGTLTAEITPHNLILTAGDAARLGPYGKVVPPLRAADDCAAGWSGLLDGTIDIVATDHAPHAVSEKEAGLSDLSKAPGGFPGVQTLLPVLLEAAASGLLTYEQLARVASESPAQIFGLYPRKGVIAVGSDADLVLVDPQRQWTIRNEDQQSLARITPFAGRSIRGYPEFTLLRGMVVMENGQIVGNPNGQFVAPAHV